MEPVLTLHSRSTNIRWSENSVIPSLSGPLTIPEPPSTLNLRLRQNGSVAVARDGRSLTRFSLTSLIPGLPESALECLNDALDHLGAPQVTVDVQEAIDASGSYDETFYRATKQNRGEQAAQVHLRLLSAAYPVYSTLIRDPFNDGFYDDAETILETETGFMYATSVREFVNTAFGCWRKDLVKLALAATPKTVTWLSWFKSALTVDQFVRAFRHFEAHPMSMFTGGLLTRGFVRQMLRDVTHPTSVYNLAIFKNQLDAFENHMIAECWVGGDESLKRKLSGWRELLKTAQRVTAQRMKGVTAVTPPEFQSLNTEGATTPYVLRTPADYFDTGNTMGVCIGQIRYITSAARGENVHIRFQDADDKPLALLDLRKEDSRTYTVVELAGNKNAAIPQQDRERLLDLVRTQTHVTIK